MFSNMKAAIVKFYKEMKLQLTIRFKDGRRELALYRLERDHGMSILWVPSKGGWVRARALYWGQKNVLVQFVDGAEKTGYRSPLSIWHRSPGERGCDKPHVDARYSGNAGWICGPKGMSTWLKYYLTPAPGMTIGEMRSAIATLAGGTHG